MMPLQMYPFGERASSFIVRRQTPLSPKQEALALGIIEVDSSKVAALHGMQPCNEGFEDCVDNEIGQFL
jgi:hypothetical protein